MGSFFLPPLVLLLPPATEADAETLLLFFARFLVSSFALLCWLTLTFLEFCYMTFELELALPLVVFDPPEGFSSPPAACILSTPSDL